MDESSDNTLWSQEIRDVTPLNVAASSRQMPDTIQMPPVLDSTISDIIDPDDMMANVLQDTTSLTVLSPSRRHVARAPQRMDPNMLRKIKAGRMTISRTLDMHDMSQDHAYACLHACLTDAHHAHTPLILVITGKGSVTKGGILRKQLPRWLSEPPLSAMVVAYHSAHARHGGSGAYYIQVRKYGR